MKKYVLMSLMSIVAVSAWAQEATPATAEQRTVSLGPKIAFSEETYNFGSMMDTSTVRHTFVIKNEGDETLNITRVKASCGCTTSSLKKKNLEPGESTELNATLRLKGRSGNLSKSIRVSSNDPKRPNVNLIMRGQVTSIITAAPRYLNFGQKIAGKSYELPITVTISDGEDMNVISAHSLQKKTEVVLTTNTPGKSYTVLVTVPEDATQGRLHDRVRITTDSNAKKYLDVPVNVELGDKVFLNIKKIRLRESKTPSTQYLTLTAMEVDEMDVTEVVLPQEGAEAVITPFGADKKRYRIMIKNLIPSMDINGSNVVIRTSVEGSEEISVPIEILGR